MVEATLNQSPSTTKPSNEVKSPAKKNIKRRLRKLLELFTGLGIKVRCDRFVLHGFSGTDRRDSASLLYSVFFFFFLMFFLCFSLLKNLASAWHQYTTSL